jgi:hypothetical protein
MRIKPREWISQAQFAVNGVSFELSTQYPPPNSAGAPLPKATLTVGKHQYSVTQGSSALNMLEACYDMLYYTCTEVEWSNDISTICELVKEFELKHIFVKHIKSSDYLWHMFVFKNLIKIQTPTRTESYTKPIDIEEVLKDFRKKFKFWSPLQAAALARIKRKYINL